MNGRLTRVDPPAQRGTVRERYLVRGTIAPRFVAARAVTADEAIAFTPTDPREARAFAAMIADGSIRSAGGRFWFDMDAYEAAAAARRAKRVPVLLMVALLVAAAAVVFYRG